MSTTIRGTSKEPLLRRVAQGYRALRSALEALPRDRFDQKLSTGWSLKQNLAHLAAWEETVPPRVRAVLGNGEDPKLYEDIDAFNARAVREAEGKTAALLFARWTTAHDELLVTVRDLPEDAPDLALKIVEWNTIGHYPDHYADIGVAIRDAKDLFGVVQPNWVPFRLAIGALGIPMLERQTWAGWTYKDLAAHVAAWESRTADRLRTFRETGRQTFPGIEDTDEFNAQVVERTRGRDGRAVLAELDAAHGRLLPEIEKLTAEQIHATDDWAIAIVAGNTYGHYAEHFDEVYAAVPTRPAELLARMREGWRPFRVAVGRLGRTALARTTPAGWTYKGMLSHVAHWMELVPPELPTRLAGGRSAPADVDAENADEARAAVDRTADEVLHRLDAAYRAVVQAVEALPADQEIPFLAVRLVVGETYGHFVEHGSEIEGALPRTASAMVARVDELWAPFRAAIRERGRAGLVAPTSAGWTYRDLCAHAAAWMQEAVRELESGEFAKWSKDAIQVFNDRAVEAHRLVGPEAMLDELDTSERRVRQVIAGLDDARLASDQVFDLAAWCTYLHWEEHFAELGISE